MRSLVALLFAGVILAAPLAASAATVNFFGPIVPAECNCFPGNPENPGRVPGAPDWGCVLATLQNAVTFAISIGVVIVVLMMAYAGILWIASPFNPHNREEGRTLLINSVIGLVITLAAWLIVDFVMKALYNPDAAAGYTKGGPLPWESILGDGDGLYCLQQAELPGPSAAPGGTSRPSASRRPIGGTCSAPSAPNACAEANLTAAFGAAAQQAAKICGKESGGNPQALSRTDKLADGSAYSVGLFQINLTNSFSQRVNGKNCSEAFSAPCQGRRAVQQSGSNIGRCTSTVVDRTLYNACVAAAKNPQTNIAEAKRLYDGDWGRWKNSAIACSLPY